LARRDPVGAIKDLTHGGADFTLDSRSGLTSSAMTRAPIAAASWVADRPTGP
jgi:hypothetical protein